MRALELRAALLILTSLTCLVAASGCDGYSSASDAAPSEAADDGVTVSGSQISIDLASDRGKPLAAPGGFVFVDEADAIAINTAGTIRAFSSVCTGDACPVDRFVEGQLICSCDGSSFSPSGVPVQGAASAPLVRYSVTRSGDVVRIALTSSDPDPDPGPVPPPYGY